VALRNAKPGIWAIVIPTVAKTARTMIWRTAKSTEVNSPQIAPASLDAMPGPAGLAGQVDSAARPAMSAS